MTYEDALMVVADEMGAAMSWPTHIEDVAEMLAISNPDFDIEKWKQRAWKAWEDTHLP